MQKMAKKSTITLGTIERAADSTVTENVGVNLQESKRILHHLQETVVGQQLQAHCEQKRRCPSCGTSRPVKDYRRRRLDIRRKCARDPIVQRGVGIRGRRAIRNRLGAATLIGAIAIFLEL